MSIANWFSFGGGSSSPSELPDIFPIGMVQVDFIRIDVMNIYSKILTDVVERTHGLSEDEQNTLWDNCVKSESTSGLITLLATAMTDKTDLFLVYEPGIKVLRRATGEEQAKITEEYKNPKLETHTGLYVSFKNYTRTDMVKLWSSLEYATVCALNKQMNLSKALQFKMSDLRATTSLTDSAAVTTQALAAARAMACGKDVLIDAKDVIETAKPDLTATQSAMEFLNEKRAFYLGLPDSYICGEQTGGVGSTGENDTKATERGLKNYFSSIMKPVLESLFDATITYKSQDFRQISSALEAMKTFELTDESLITHDNKKKIIEGLLDIDEDDNKDTTNPLPPEPAVAALPPGANPVATPAAPKGNA